MNDPVVIQMPARVAVKVVAKAIAILIVGIVFAFISHYGDAERHLSLQSSTPEGRQQDFERYVKKVELEAGRNTSEVVFLSTFMVLCLVGIYELATFFAALILGRFVRVRETKNEDSEKDMYGQPDGGGQRW